MKSTNSKVKGVGISQENDLSQQSSTSSLPLLQRPMSNNEVVIFRNGEELKHDRRVNMDLELKELVTGVHPIDYETELIDKKNEIRRDNLKDLLLFPADDVSLFKRNRELKTEYSTVPPQAFKDATNLLVRECLNVYTCDHYILQNNYKKFTSHQWVNGNVQSIKDLQKPLYEVDVLHDEVDGVQENMLVPTKENGIWT